MGGGSCDYSDETARVVDSEVSRILAEAHARTKELIATNRATLERIANRLLETETLTGEEIRKLIAGEGEQLVVTTS